MGNRTYPEITVQNVSPLLLLGENCSILLAARLDPADLFCGKFPSSVLRQWLYRSLWVSHQGEIRLS